MEDISARHTASVLEEALALAGKGRLGDVARARLWALAAEGAIAHETAHALVALDTEVRGKEAKALPVGRPASQASRREEIRLAWAHAVPWSLRGRMELPLATWAVLGMLIARARFSHSEWRAELSSRNCSAAWAAPGGRRWRAPSRASRRRASSAPSAASATRASTRSTSMSSSTRRP